MYRSILVPVDGSEHARAALEVARTLADQQGATIHLLNVFEPPQSQNALGLSAETFDMNVATEHVQRAVSRAEQSGHEVMERMKTVVGPDGPALRSIMRFGRPAEVIVSEAETLGVDAIVMGSRGLSDLQGLFVGSVSHRVMHTARCRVITVR